MGIVRAGRDQMPLVVDIIRSSAKWYEPIVATKDQGEHWVGADWAARNFAIRRFYLGQVEGQTVGTISLQDAGDYLYVGYLYLFTSQVGKGYGHRLLEFALAEAQRLGKRGIVLIAHPEAVWANRAYEKFGFRIAATERAQVLAWNDGWLKPYYEEGFELYLLDVEQAAAERVAG